MSNALISVHDLRKSFDVPRLPGASRNLGARLSDLLNRGEAEAASTDDGASDSHVIRAIDGLNFEIERGSALGLVGESGCGKTTVARCLLRLVHPDSGDILFDGKSILEIKGRELKAFRKKAQIVFQDPLASLNPRFTVYKALAEPLRVHNLVPKQEREQRILELIEAVHLRVDHLHRYPHQLSGGERQRVVIARALATRPDLLILDEPTSALDVSARVQIIRLLLELQAKFSMTYLVISHDLSIIRHMCNRVIVMYLGKVMEVAETVELIEIPLHPYTQALMSAISIPDPDHQAPRIRLRGDAQDVSGPSDICPLAPRCHMAVEACFQRHQELVQIEETRWVACHRVSEGEIDLVEKPLKSASR